MRKVLLAISAILISACASTEVQQSTPFVKPSEESSATVYVFRSQSMPKKANVKVEIDGKQAALLPDNRFTWVKLEPGRKVVRIGYPSFPDMSKSATLDLKPGKSYLVQYRGSAGGPDRPIFGIGGNFIGTIRVGEEAWTSVELVPSEGIEKMTSTFQYVPAKP